MEMSDRAADLLPGAWRPGGHESRVETSAAAEGRDVAVDAARDANLWEGHRVRFADVAEVVIGQPRHDGARHDRPIGLYRVVGVARAASEKGGGTLDEVPGGIQEWVPVNDLARLHPRNPGLDEPLDTGIVRLPGPAPETARCIEAAEVRIELPVNTANRESVAVEHGLLDRSALVHRHAGDQLPLEPAGSELFDIRDHAGIYAGATVMVGELLRPVDRDEDGVKPPQDFIRKTVEQEAVRLEHEPAAGAARHYLLDEV